MHAIQYSWEYQVAIKRQFKKSSFSYNTIVRENLRRVSSMIKNDISGGHFAYRQNAFRVYDMIRTSVFVKDCTDIPKAYEMISQVDKVTIIRVVNKLNNLDDCISMNFLYDNSIIGEFMIRIGNAGGNEDATRFVNFCATADTPVDFAFVIF